MKFTMRTAPRAGGPGITLTVEVEHGVNVSAEQLEYRLERVLMQYLPNAADQWHTVVDPWPPAARPESGE